MFFKSIFDMICNGLWAGGGRWAMGRGPRYTAHTYHAKHQYINIKHQYGDSMTTMWKFIMSIWSFITSLWWFDPANMMISTHQYNDFITSIWWFHHTNMMISSHQYDDFITSIWHFHHMIIIWAGGGRWAVARGPRPTAHTYHTKHHFISSMMWHAMWSYLCAI